MGIISKVSKGTMMDQIYIPKNRHGLNIGEYVLIKPAQKKKETRKPYFHNAKELEPLKLKIIDEIFLAIERNTSKYDNIIITGSFLDKGFNFNDIDVIIVTGQKSNPEHIKNAIEKNIGLVIHILTLDNKSLIQGLSTDPLYQMMLSKCASIRRIIYNVQRKIDYKILDLHLLKSKTLFENFDILNGNEKYYLTRNMAAIFLFLKHKKVNKEAIDEHIKKFFNLKNADEIKMNMLDKELFLKKYKDFYSKAFSLIMENVKNEPKQK